MNSILLSAEHFATTDDAITFLNSLKFEKNNYDELFPFMLVVDGKTSFARIRYNVNFERYIIEYRI